MKRIQFIVGYMVIVVTLASSQSAQAFLGGNVDSISSDQLVLQAVNRSTTALNGYTVEEIVSETTTVREFVSSSGIVFAIAWNGYIHPDLSQLLGSYWGEYSANQQKAVRHSGSKRQQVETGNVVVDKWGRMKDLHGRAYVPSLVPEGLNLGEIK